MNRSLPDVTPALCWLQNAWMSLQLPEDLPAERVVYLPDPASDIFVILFIIILLVVTFLLGPLFGGLGPHVAPSPWKRHPWIVISAAISSPCPQTWDIGLSRPMHGAKLDLFSVPTLVTQKLRSSTCSKTFTGRVHVFYIGASSSALETAWNKQFPTTSHKSRKSPGLQARR